MLFFYEHVAVRMNSGRELQVVSTFTSKAVKHSLKRSLANARIDNTLSFVRFTQLSEYLLVLNCVS